MNAADAINSSLTAAERNAIEDFMALMSRRATDAQMTAIAEKIQSAGALNHNGVELRGTALRALCMRLRKGE